jgi:Zn-dependent peptidase ImmA (M78 family)
VGWLKEFPIKAMIDQGWIDEAGNEVDQLNKLLHFFGIAWPKQWGELWRESAVNFRKSAAFESDLKALSAWLRQGELEAQQIRCQPFDEDTFRHYLANEIRNLTVQPPEIFQDELERLCALSGVAVVFVPQLPKARVSGATRWLHKDKALIQLSLRYKTDDHLWFTFFHEAGHILLHGKRDIFLEADGNTNEKEKEANKFSREILIPKEHLKRFLKQKKPSPRSKNGIRLFARELGIAPGIVVGRLQHDGHLPYQNCNELKTTLRWA